MGEKTISQILSSFLPCTTTTKTMDTYNVSLHLQTGKLPLTSSLQFCTVTVTTLKQSI